MKIQVKHLPGQELNRLPIWIAKTPEEIALQIDSRILKKVAKKYAPPKNYREKRRGNDDSEVLSERLEREWEDRVSNEYERQYGGY